jgi:hypothetical protein
MSDDADAAATKMGGRFDHSLALWQLSDAGTGMPPASDPTERCRKLLGGNHIRSRTLPALLPQLRREFRVYNCHIGKFADNLFGLGLSFSKAMCRSLQCRPLPRTPFPSRRKQRWTAILVAIPVITLSILLSDPIGQAAEISTGSGVVIRAQGEILTNAHVVEGCQNITVKLASGISEVGVLVASDEKNDVALVRLKNVTNPLPSVAVFREGAPVRPGEAVVALGYPLSGLLSSEANVSVGNVSALAGLHDDSRYLQISAPVQPGNSGGPLLDASGHPGWNCHSQTRRHAPCPFHGRHSAECEFRAKGRGRADILGQQRHYLPNCAVGQATIAGRRRSDCATLRCAYPMRTGCLPVRH